MLLMGRVVGGVLGSILKGIESHVEQPRGEAYRRQVAS